MTRETSSRDTTLEMASGDSVNGYCICCCLWMSVRLNRIFDGEFYGFFYIAWWVVDLAVNYKPPPLKCSRQAPNGVDYWS